MSDIYDLDYRETIEPDMYDQERDLKNYYRGAHQEEEFFPSFPLKEKELTVVRCIPCFYAGNSDKRCGTCTDCREARL